jgi:hypothetical protein
MNRVTLCLFLFCMLVTHFSFAGDTTSPKKPLFLSVSAGYASTHAAGSLVDMVQSLDRQYGIRNAYQKNGGGFAIDVLVQKQFLNLVYYKTGLGYIQKHVFPEGNSYPLYKDSLNTGYLTVPFLFGLAMPLNRSRSIYLSIDAGPVGNIAIVDDSYKAPDRVGYKTMLMVLGVSGGAGISFGLPGEMRLMIHYSYSADITNSVNETLYWGAPNEMYRTRSYKYDVQSFSIGFVWPLRKV